MENFPIIHFSSAYRLPIAAVREKSPSFRMQFVNTGARIGRQLYRLAVNGGCKGFSKEPWGRSTAASNCPRLRP